MTKLISLEIEPHDPLIVRDGRPFGIEAGNRMYCLDWPFPSTLAGFLRTFMGKKAAPKGENPFGDKNLSLLKGIGVKGPFPLVEERLYFPAPLDLVVYEENNIRSLMPLRPEQLREGEGTNLPMSNLLWPLGVTNNVKPTVCPAFWSVDKMNDWLVQDPAVNFKVPSEGEGFLKAIDKELRAHVSIDANTNLAKDEHFFFTSGLVLLQKHEDGNIKQVKIGAQLEINNKELIDSIEKKDEGKRQLGLHPFGGERRLASICQSKSKGWEMPHQLATALKKPSGLRMILATPAFFNNSWCPEWLDENTLEGKIPGCELKVKLRGACVGTWKPLSGWDMENKRPKPVRKLVPAGSVYFFEILAGDPGLLKDCWLRSVCVGKQQYDEARKSLHGKEIEKDQLDGFGLALWGIWNRN